MNNPARIRDSRQPGHFWADNEIVDQYLPTIGAYGFAVYMLLTRYANNKTGQCDPSVKTIGTALGISPPTVQKALKALVDAGLIKITYRPRSTKDRKVNETNIYTLLAVEKSQGGTQGDWVPKEIGYGVPNDVGKGTQGDLPGVPNHVVTNKTHINKTIQEGVQSEETRVEKKPLDELSHALFSLCLFDPDLAPKSSLAAMRKTYKALRDKGATCEQVANQFTAYWYSDDNWMARKAREAGRNAEPPTPDQVTTEWAKAMAWKPAKPASKGVAPTVALNGVKPAKPADAQSAQETAAKMKALLERTRDVP